MGCQPRVLTVGGCQNCPRSLCHGSWAVQHCTRCVSGGQGASRVRGMMLPSPPLRALARAGTALRLGVVGGERGPGGSSQGVWVLGCCYRVQLMLLCAAAAARDSKPSLPPPAWPLLRSVYPQATLCCRNSIAVISGWLVVF